MTYYRPRKFVDFHAHVFPDDVAPKVMTMFRSVNRFSTMGDGTVAETLRLMDKAGIDICVVQPVAAKASQVRSINDWAFSVRSDRLASFGALHPDYPDPKAEVDRLLDMGFRGIKIQPGWQEFYPDEEKAFPMYEACEGRIAVLFHAGNELNKNLAVTGLPHCFRNVHDRFPNLTMILAHMGGYQLWSEAEQCMAGTGVYLDNSYCPEDELPDEEMVRLIGRYGAERVLLASDFPLTDPREGAERLCRMDLSPDQKEDIAWRNAFRLLGMPE